jgi:hypothetical protein
VDLGTTAQDPAPSASFLLLPPLRNAALGDMTTPNGKRKSPQEWEELKQGTTTPLVKTCIWKKIALASKWQNSSKALSGGPKKQYMSGYTVVIFRRYANGLFELSSHELPQFWQDVSRLAKVLYGLYQLVSTAPDFRKRHQLF